VVRRAFRSGVEQQAHLLPDGMVLGARHGEKGYFVQPTVFSNVNMTHQIAQEEIFGPVASIIKFKDEKEAISIANDTTYGLAAAVHTLDASQMARVTRRLRAGT
jgi:aldehyde dehydrogenase (NAD+)